jgi:hypothetical protein
MSVSSSSSSDSSKSTLHELDDKNLEFVPSLSLPNRLVFRLCNCLGDESISLSKINIMFRGDEESILTQLNRIYLVLRKDETGESCVSIDEACTAEPKTAVIGEADVDPDMEDVRVLVFPQWNKKIPLPLGDSLQTKLYIYVHTNQPMDKERVKFGADMIKTPQDFLDNRLKRMLKQSLIRVEYGCLKMIDSPRLAEFPEEVYSSKFLVLGESSVKMRAPAPFFTERKQTWFEKVLALMSSTSAPRFATASTPAKKRVPI